MPKIDGNVDESDAANLHVMALQLVPAADQHVVAAPARDHEIVRDEPMAALDEIEHALRLADAASTHEQQPDAEHVRERPVQVRRRRELFLEPRLDSRVELVRLEPRADQRDPGVRRKLDEIRARLLSLRDEHARDGKGEERRQDACAASPDRATSDT